MLDLGAYLLGIVALALLATSAWLGGTAARRRLLPEFDGAPAHLATSVLALALVIWPAELLGTCRPVRTAPISGGRCGDRRFYLEAASRGSERHREPTRQDPEASTYRR